MNSNNEPTSAEELDRRAGELARRVMTMAAHPRKGLRPSITITSTAAAGHTEKCETPTPKGSAELTKY